LLTKDLKVNEFSYYAGPNNTRTGFGTQFDDYLDLDTYKRIKSITFEWTVDVTAQPRPIPPAVPKTPKEVRPGAEYLDHCAPGLGREQRLERLKQYGKIRETGSNAYQAGGREIHFFYDGSVLYCR
jgi:hypothetical protein